MILKEPDKSNAADKFSKAGQRAEEQMAFYLKRAFSDDKRIFVMNGIRLERQDDSCQIDHLVLHEYGMIIVESKSVTTKVKINERGEWHRLFDNHWQGMKSPLIQAGMQARFLKGHLNANKEKLLKRILGLQAHFDKMPVDLIVAISDSGVIDRPKGDDDKNILKAEQVPGRISEIFAGYKEQDNPFKLSLSFGPAFIISEESLKRVRDFLLCEHKPIVYETGSISAPKQEQKAPDSKKEIPPAPVAIKEKPEEYKVKGQTSTCPECRNRMNIHWGEKYHNYYWLCPKCDKAVPIRDICPGCSRQLKVRKQKEQYFLYCETCKVEGLYHMEEAVKIAPQSSHIPVPKQAADKAAFLCKKCSKSNLQIVYGEYGYYFKCQDCSGNTPLKLFCKNCGGKELVHKSGQTFTAECHACKTSRTFFENKI